MSAVRAPRIMLALLLGAAALAGSVGAQEGCPPPSADGIRLALAPRNDNSLVVDATVQLERPAALRIEYGNESLGWLRAPAGRAATVHRRPLLRLRAETAYRARALALGEDGCPTAVAAGDFTTGPLPAHLRQLVIEASGPTSVPLTLVDFRLSDARPKDDYRYFVILDHEFQPVWYYPIPRDLLTEAAGMGANGITRLSNGNWLYLARDYGVEEVSPDARAIRRIALPGWMIHHDVQQLPDGRVLFMGTEIRAHDDSAVSGKRNLPFRGDTLNALDLSTGLAERLWSAHDTHDPSIRPRHWNRFYRGHEDWTHGNTIAFGPSGNVLLSFRHLDQVLSLAPDLRTIQWRLGGADSDFAFTDPADVFRGQHTVSQLSNGNLLLFDNANYHPLVDSSRAIELELDFGSMTARKVWEYRHTPDVFSETQSSAYRLANGNTLISFGTRDNPGEPVVLVEIRPDGSAATTMNARVAGQRTSRYRAYPLETVGGEEAVTAPAAP